MIELSPEIQPDLLCKVQEDLIKTEQLSLMRR